MADSAELAFNEISNDEDLSKKLNLKFKEQIQVVIIKI